LEGLNFGTQLGDEFHIALSGFLIVPKIRRRHPRLDVRQATA
jgi:hypothetical protein